MIKLYDEDKITRIVQPYLDRVLPAAAAEAQAISASAQRTARGLAVSTLARQILFMRRGRNPAGVRIDYDGLYEQGIETLERGLSRDGSPKPFRFSQSTVLLMHTGGLYAAYLEALSDAIAMLRPATVREIGFGSGKNLFFLAQRFPDIALSGFELTAGGAALAAALQQRESLPPNLAYLVARGEKMAEAARMRSIEFKQGDACALPAGDKSVDLSFTMLALEQMWPILPRALAEIRRTTRKYAVFIEAFGEANDRAGRLHLWSRNYFRASLAQMEAAGFRPLQLFTTLPRKFTFSAAMLIAEVVE